MGTPDNIPANTSKNKTYILKIEDMSESDKEKYLKR
jgi:hypothetical protein